MDTGSSVNIYSYLFGWHVYDMLYGFVMATGLWTIPFFVMFYKIFFVAAYSGGDSYDPKKALVALELYFYPAVIVYLVFFIPTIPLSSSNFEYYDGDRIQKVGSTNTQYDRLQSLAPDSVKIPAGWYVVLLTTSGLNGVMKSILPDAFQTRDLMYSLQQTKLDDPKIEAKLKDFLQRCRNPALARLNAIRKYYPGSKIAEKFDQLKKEVTDDTKGIINNVNSTAGGGTNHWKIQELYPGNLYFMDYLYDDTKLCPSTSDPHEYAKNNLCIPRVSIPLYPLPNDRCDDMWDGGGIIRTGLVDELQTAYGQIPVGGIDEDKFVSAKLLGNDRGIIALVPPASGKDTGLQNLANKVQGFFLNMQNIINDFSNSVVRFMLPVIQSVILLLLFMILVVVMLAGGYSLPTVANLAILLFGVSFLTSIWNIIGWIDNVMLTTLYAGTVGVFEKGLTLLSLERAVWDLVVFAAYGFSSIVWINFVREMGALGAQAVSAGLHSTHGAGDAGRGRDLGKKAWGGAKKTGKAAWDATGKGK